MDSVVYLNGAFLKASEAKISIFDRGLLFADAVYEVIPVYQGRPYELKRHLLRLERSLAAIKLAIAKLDFSAIVDDLCRLNGGGDLQIYLQITRGNQGFRKHDIPKDLTPTVIAFSMHTPYTSDEQKRQGLKATVVEDNRWLRCDIKACSLLANILLHDEAQSQGGETAVLTRDGYLTEGAASNIFIVDNEGIIKTPPLSNLCLPGITRAITLELIQNLALPFREEAIPTADLFKAKEIMMTSTTKEIYPITSLNNQSMGSGVAGPCWERLNQAFHQRKAAYHD